MDANTISQIIGSLGFPIAACIGLFWYMFKQEERHTVTSEKINQAIVNNTAALTELSVLLKKELKEND